MRSLEPSQEAKALKPGIYRHFKGNLYQLMAVGRHSETEEEMVIYRTLYGSGGIWVRPLKMFTEHVDRGGYSGPRFIFVETK